MDKGIATVQAGVAADKANSASINKDSTDTNVITTAQHKTVAEQKAQEATEQSLLAEYYANLAQSIVSTIPMRYYRPTEDAMWLIQNPVQGSLCYVTYFDEGKSDLFVYDTTDMDMDK